VSRSLLVGLVTAVLGVAGCGGDSADEGADDTVASEPEAGWSYAGDTGPERWADLDPAYRECADGREQSPIDLAAAGDGELPRLAFDYRPAAGIEANENNHIEVLVEDAGALSTGGADYALHNYHFHMPSEHRIGKRSYPAEMHLVHSTADDELAVIGVFLEEGEENAALAASLAEVPREPGEEREVDSEVDPLDLIPDRGSGKVYRYEGSLTTPPCSEEVLWTVYQQPIEASSEQLTELATAYDDNARPLQPLNGRELIRGEVR
jgi:carbonic anhydrase